MSRQTLSDGNSLNSNSAWCGWDSEVGVNIEHRVDTTTITSTDAFGQRVNGNVSCENIFSDQIVVDDLDSDYQIIPYDSVVPFNQFTKTPRSIKLTGTVTSNAAILLPFSNQPQADSSLGFARVADLGSEWEVINTSSTSVPVYTFDYTNYVPGTPPTFAKGEYLMNLPPSEASADRMSSTTFHLSGNEISSGKEDIKNWSYHISDGINDYFTQQIATADSPYQLLPGTPHFYRLRSTSAGASRIVKLPDVATLGRGETYTLFNYRDPNALGVPHAPLEIQTFDDVFLYTLRPLEIVQFTSRGSGNQVWIINQSGSIRKVISDFSDTFTPSFDDGTTYASQEGSFTVDIRKHTNATTETQITVTSQFVVNVYSFPFSNNLTINLPVPSEVAQTVMVDCYQGGLGGAAYTHHRVPLVLTALSSIGTCQMNFNGINGNDDTWIMNFTYRGPDYP